MSRETIGALIGWKRASVEHGTLVTMQLAASGEALSDRDFDLARVFLADHQLTSFIRDLNRAARERGISVGPSKRR